MSEEPTMLQIALQAADAGSAGHWPTVAGVLADEYRKAEAEILDARIWQDIESAPKDGTCIDLWCVDPDGQFIPANGGIRFPDCWWHFDDDDTLDIPGWARMLDDGNREMIERGPTNYLGCPPWEPTHWMPLPTPPKP